MTPGSVARSRTMSCRVPGRLRSLYDPQVVRVDDFDFELPESLIAQAPPAERGTSRLLVLERATGRTRALAVTEFVECLREGDVLVVNDTRVFPARLLGRRDPSGGLVECLLLQRDGDDEWPALVHPGQTLQPGARMIFEGNGRGPHRALAGRETFAKRRVRLSTRSASDVMATIEGVLGNKPEAPVSD